MRLSWLICIPLAATAQSSSPAGEYDIRFVTTPSLRAIVRARFDKPASSLRMGTGAIDHLPDMWGTFVNDLSARDASGNAVTVTVARDTLLGRTWSATSGNAISSIDYSVDLRFTQEKWPPGNEQAGLWADSALFLVTKALFVAPEREGSWRVTFDVPRTWRISQPWSAPAADGKTFTVASQRSLFGNTIVVGKHAEYRFTSGDFDITLALVGPAARGATALRETFEPVLKDYVRIFAATPPTRYMMTVFYGDEDDGEGFETSSAFRTTVPIVRELRLMWGHTVAHELLHMWNGHQLRGDNKEMSEWLQEGFTEYMANRTLLRTGMISREDFLRKAESNISLYSYFRTSGLFDTVSVRKSGTRKWRFRFGVYNGGWATAFALDQTLLEKTGDKRGLNDLMRLLYQRYALGDRPWTYEGLISASSEIAGADMRPFFAKYVDGLEPLPLKPLLERLGYTLLGQGYAAEMYIRPNPLATSVQRQRGNAFTARGSPR